MCYGICGLQIVAGQHHHVLNPFLVKLADHTWGVLLRMDAVDNTIGGTGEAEGNVIAGYSWHGIWLAGTADENTVQGNTVGLDAIGKQEQDRLKPRVVSSQIIRHIDPHQVQLINRIADKWVKEVLDGNPA